MVTKLPPVSIGIPFFNAERFLLDAIKSVFAQSHQDWELILVDDGSTDRSLSIANSIADPRVRVYSDGKNKRLAARLNEINRMAKYDFIARMDADDLMATNRIEKQLATLIENPATDLVTTGVCSITDAAVPYGARVVAMDHAVTPCNVLSGRHGIVHAAILGRREWFLRNPYDPSDHLAEDYRLWVRSEIKRDLAVAFIREPLYFYREEGSVTPEKILVSQRIRREVIGGIGRQLVSASEVARLLAESHLKSIIMRTAVALGGIKYVVRARSPAIASADVAMVDENVSRIQGVRVDLN